MAHHPRTIAQASRQTLTSPETGSILTRLRKMAKVSSSLAFSASKPETKTLANPLLAIKLTLIDNWAPCSASSVRQARRHIGELQLFIQVEFPLADAGSSVLQRHLPDWGHMSITRIANDELAEDVSTRIATSAMTGMSGNLVRFETKMFLKTRDRRAGEVWEK